MNKNNFSPYNIDKSNFDNFRNFPHNGNSRKNFSRASWQENGRFNNRFNDFNNYRTDGFGNYFNEYSNCWMDDDRYYNRPPMTSPFPEFREDSWRNDEFSRGHFREFNRNFYPHHSSENPAFYPSFDNRRFSEISPSPSNYNRTVQRQRVNDSWRYDDRSMHTKKAPLINNEIKNEPEKNFISNIKNEPEKNFVSNIKNEPEKNFASNIKNEPEKDFVPNISTVDGQKEGDTTNVFQNVFPKYSESDVKYQPIESTEVDEQDEKKNLFYKDGEADKNSENNKECFSQIAESAVNIENTKLDNIHSIKNEDQSSFMSEVAESNAKYNLVIRKDFGHDQIHYFKPNTSRKKRNRKKKSMKSQSSKSSEKISGEHQNFSASSSPDIDPKDYIEKLSNASSSSTEENATNQASSVKVSSCSLNIKAPLLKKPPCSVSQSQPHENYGFFSGPVIAGPSKIHVKRPSSLASSRPGLLDGPTPQKKAPVLQQSSLKPPLLGEFPRTGVPSNRPKNGPVVPPSKLPNYEGTSNTSLQNEVVGAVAEKGFAKILLANKEFSAKIEQLCNEQLRKLLGNE